MRNYWEAFKNKAIIRLLVFLNITVTNKQPVQNRILFSVILLKSMQQIVQNKYM